MEIFKVIKRKEPKVKNDAKEQAGRNRQSGQNIIDELGKINFANKSRDISDDKLREYKEYVKGFQTVMEQAPASAADFQEIDGLLVELVGNVGHALQEGNEKTADWIFKMLHFGIVEARRDTEGLDQEKMAVLLEKRKNKLKKYANLSEMANAIDDFGRKIQTVEVLYQQNKEEYKKAYEDARRMEQDFPELAEELDRAVLDERLSGPALILDTKKKRVIDLYNSMEDTKKIQASMIQKKEALTSHLNLLKIQMINDMDMVDEQLLSDLEAFQREFREFAAQEQKDVKLLNASMEEFHHTLDAIFSSEDMINSVLKNEMEYQKLLQRELEHTELRQRKQEETETQERKINLLL